jgi:pimeloyl-ACP methyl ester carboxylesterase
MMGIKVSHKFVLIRGLARESGHWGSFKEQLHSQDYCVDVFGVDLPGAGMYHKISSPLTIRENAEFIMAKINEFREPDEKIVILSVSLGSMVAIEMASLYPECFHQVYLMNTSVAGLSPIYHRLKIKALKHFYKILTTSEIKKREKEVIAMVSNKPQHWEKTAEEWVEIANLRPISPANFLRQLLAASYYRLPRNKPTVPLIVFNSQDDHMVDPKCSRALAKHWKLPIFFNKGAGHELALDDPDWVLQRLAENITKNISI